MLQNFASRPKFGQTESVMTIIAKELLRKDSPIPAHDYDIIEGPIADDKISQHITLYVNGKIS
jgi:hypothetical protein